MSFINRTDPAIAELKSRLKSLDEVCLTNLERDFSPCWKHQHAPARRRRSAANHRAVAMRRTAATRDDSRRHFAMARPIGRVSARRGLKPNVGLAFEPSSR